jgi:hypothetical protein
MPKFNNKAFDNWIKETMYQFLPSSFSQRGHDMSKENQDYLYELTCRKCCFSQTPETRKIFDELIGGDHEIHNNHSH